MDPHVSEDGFFSAQFPARRRQQLHLEDLCIVDLPAPGEGNKVKPWRGQVDLFAAERCARVLYVLPRAQLATIPEQAMRFCRTHCCGIEAYKFLLEFACGLQSEKKGEYFVLSQLKQHWEAFDRAHPDYEPTISRLIQFIFEDSKAIRERVLKRLILEAQNHALGRKVAARALAGISGGEDILIIAGSEAETLELAQVLGRACGRKADGRIVVTHVNPEVAQQRHAALLCLKRDKKLDCTMEIIAFDEIERAVNSSDHVFVIMPMAPADCGTSSEHYQQDRRIQQAWIAREREDGFLIHLKGDPKSRGATTPDWAEMRDPHYRFFSPEAVLQRHQQHVQENNLLIATAKTAAQNCAFSRSIGERPRFDDFQLPHDRYKAACVGDEEAAE